MFRLIVKRSLRVLCPRPPPHRSLRLHSNFLLGGIPDFVGSLGLLTWVLEVLLGRTVPLEHAVMSTPNLIVTSSVVLIFCAVHVVPSELTVSNNWFTGTIPTALGQLANLVYVGNPRCLKTAHTRNV